MGVELIAKVRFFGNLSRHEAGEIVTEESVSVPAKLGSVLASLQTKHGMDLKREGILVLVNGIEANSLDEMDTVVNDGDEIALLPIYHGGLS
ncbi:MAG: MoaD/ThiS family protein [Nitrososphaerales archaeon]